MSAQNIAQQDIIAVFVSGRRSESSTEAFLSLVGRDEPELFLDLRAQDGRQIGHLALRRVADDLTNPRGSAGTYEVHDLLPAGSPCPGPVVSLSGVLWPRRAILG